MQSLRILSVMKRPIIIPSTPSTPPSPQTTLHSKTTTFKSLSSKKPRNILTNPTPTTTTTEQEPIWIPLNLSRSELYLPLTFPTGQTFRWKQTGPTQYTGVVGRSHLVSLKQLDNGDVGYHFYCTRDNCDASDALLDFLNVGISLNEVWEGFKANDTRFAELAIHLRGARVLRQDPLECLVQFICSSNNNIKRITMMVDFISSLGNYLGDVGGFKFYEFPSLERLAMVSEQDLRAAGFGYRAKYIVGTVEALKSKPGGGTEWLAALRKVDLPEAIASLCSLPGVGPKVAACIALFSLDQHHAIPVDTHVWKIATRYLLPELAGTSLTPKLHNRVADAFVRTYGKYAGWAQTLLFIAELPSQKALLNSTEEKSPNPKKRKLGRITKVLKE
ncbi:N-glycosylase/DNA lyase OGG1 [Lycium ferocissimum]|uniref:N-glycosylase/DNA lyase OGG1 n=1 Tax=Lycium ferocissimum TaxID=112874 RepID=UPI002815F4B3|nr:N-glycosylase/DNA lyase OGG1 [Lycium ferocissimum]XP_059280277.1 N-glycosylase/DNA lyase OGG1 [Lycium ferocissimum]